MHHSQLTRRRFVLASLTFSSVAITGSFLRSAAAWAESTASDSLAQFGRRLFPHDGLDDAVYRKVMDNVLHSLAANPATGNLLSDAERALNRQQGPDWIDADTAAQVAAIRNIEGEAYFAGILGAVRGAFYNHPDVWKYLNYPGSSKEHGGYKFRGFNDIDWLPEQDA